MTRLAVPVATLGPVGHWPWGPGTLASALVAAGWTWLAPPPLAWLAATALLAAVAIPAATAAERRLGHDDGRIVVDEAVGMGIALLAAPRGWPAAAAAFALFRILDVVKPPPLGRLQRVRGGAGVVLDDAVAGAATALAVGLGARWLGWGGG